MSDFECPYCGTDIDVCYDDGHGCREDMLHEDECPECNKAYVFTTSIHFYHDAKKADCLNGGEHKYKPTVTYPKRYTRMQCSDCEKERKPTSNEWKTIDPESNGVSDNE